MRTPTVVTVVNPAMPTTGFPGSARGSEVIFHEGPCAALHHRGSLWPWRLVYSPRQRRFGGTKKSSNKRWRIGHQHCAHLAELSAGIGTWRVSAGCRAS